jgi:hypothetical protein
MPTIGFPLLLIPIAIYNIIVFLMRGVAFTAPVVTLRLLSGADWTISIGDILVALGIVLILFEFTRASRPGAKYVMDHLLSLVVFAGAAAEFLWLAPFGTSTFFLLVVLAAIDCVGGLTFAMRHRKARRAARHQPLVPDDEPQADAELPRREPTITVAPPETREPAPVPDSYMEVVTPAVDSAPEPLPPKTETAQVAPADLIPDPEPPPQKPVRAVTDWSVADLIRDAEDNPRAPARPAAEGASAPWPSVVPLKD